jgi:hypothetical protein
LIAKWVIAPEKKSVSPFLLPSIQEINRTFIIRIYSLLSFLLRHKAVLMESKEEKDRGIFEETRQSTNENKIETFA